MVKPETLSVKPETLSVKPETLSRRAKCPAYCETGNRSKRDYAGLVRTAITN
jgi:hypothetical protein